MAPWSMREGSSPHEPVLDQATIELWRREAGRVRAQAEPRPTATSRRRKPAFRRSLPHTDGRFGADGITAEVAAGARREQIDKSRRSARSGGLKIERRVGRGDPAATYPTVHSAHLVTTRAAGVDLLRGIDADYWVRDD